MTTKVLNKLHKDTETLIAKVENIRKSGDLDSLRSQTNGPVKIYLPSGERDENGELVMETFLNSEGEDDVRPALSAEPFLSQVFYRRNFRTPKVQATLEEAQNLYKDEPLKMAAVTLQLMITDWDLTSGGKKVPITLEGILEADPPDVFIYAVLTACYEHNRPPKGLSGKSLNTSSQEE